MTIGIIGPKGGGKSLVMSAFIAWLDNVLDHQLPIFTSYPLFVNHAKLFTKWNEIKEQSDCIIGWDEIHLTMDSRNFKSSDSLEYTGWLSIIRHFRTTLVYTTISMDRIDQRLRNETDYVWQVQDKGNDIKIQTIDWQTWHLGRSFILSNKQSFYDLYDSYAIIQPVQMPAKKWGKK